MSLLTRVKSFTSQVFNTENYSGLFSNGSFRGGFSWDKGGSISLYEKSLYASAAIRKRSEKVGQIKFIIKDRKGTILDNKDAQGWLDLLSRPNQFQTGAQFFGLAQKYYDTVGAVYIRKVNDRVFKTGKIPTSLQLLRSDMMEVVLNTDQTEIVKFKYSGVGSKVEEIDPEEIIYWYNPSQRDPLLGESLLNSAVSAIEGEYQISKYHANVLKNGGKLETIFKIKGLKTSAQLKELRESYDESYTDAAKSGKPLFVGGDLESIQTGLSPRELGFLDTKVSTYRDLAIVTGVPKELLGNTDGSTYQNADAAVRIFSREVVKPLQGSLCEVLDWRLIPEDMWLDFEDPTPEDKEETRKDLETAYKLDALTTNEMREKLGLEPRKEKEADQVMIPFNKRALGDSTPATSATNGKSLKKKDDSHPLRDKRFREMWVKYVNAKRDQHNQRMLKETKNFFNEQRLRVVAGLKSKRKVAVDEVFNNGLEMSIADNTLVPVIREIFIEQGLAVAESFGLSEFNLTPHVERTLRERAALFTTSIINTQNDKLVALFKESADLGETRAKLVERINELYTNISEGWADVIARTEVHSAMQSANLEAYYQGGLKVKIWVWGPGVKGGAREDHQAMDGEEVPIEQAFSNGEMTPSLPNCGCTI